MASLTYGNGLVLTLTYDQFARLTGLHTAAGGTVVQNLTYTYNAANNLTTLTGWSHTHPLSEYWCDSISRH